MKLRGSLTFIAVAVAIAIGCGSSDDSTFTDPNATNDSGVGPGPFGPGDGGGADAHPCTNLCLKQTTCTGGGTTSLSGTVASMRTPASGTSGAIVATPRAGSGVNVKTTAL